MEIKDFFHVLKQRKKLVVSAWLIFMVLGSVATFSQPLKYEAKSRLLIVQNVSSADPYTISKSNQYLSNLLSQVVYSNSFFTLVTGSNNFDIDNSYFSDNYKKQMKVWEKTISSGSNDAGIIEISIYHPNPYQAKQIALGVNDVLINQGFNYQSASDNVTIKIIDQPLISSYPVKPNIIFNFLVFSILGIIAGLIYLYIFPNKRAGDRRKKINLKLKYQAEPNLQTKYEYYQPDASTVREVPEFHHPAERVMVDTNYQGNNIGGERNDNSEEEANSYQVHGDIRNVINRF